MAHHCYSLVSSVPLLRGILVLVIRLPVKPAQVLQDLEFQNDYVPNMLLWQIS